MLVCGNIMKIDYNFKANLTTVLNTVLIPVLAGYGVSSASADAVIGVLAYVICLLLAVYGEKYVSNFLTVSDDELVSDESS